MRYFTRERYEQLQKQTKAWMEQALSEEEIESRVREQKRQSIDVSRQYQDYLRQHDAQLSDAIRRLADYPLHDARIVGVQVGPDSVELILDTHGAFSAEHDSARLVFSGVKEATGLDGLLNQWILDDELFVYEDNTYEFSALSTLRGTLSEFSLRFVDVVISLSQPKQKRQRSAPPSQEH